MDLNHHVRKTKKRSPQQRVFVNRGLRLEKINFFGFDMDYTLAVYVTPEFEQLCFKLIMQRLVDVGYPENLMKFDYDSSFPVRGLWFDKQYGTLLKVDAFGNIMMCSHGFHFHTPHEIENMYPNKFVLLDENRIFVLNTLFNMPETYVYACIVNYFKTNSTYEVKEEGVYEKNLFMSYKSIFQDVRSCVDWVHTEGLGDAKKITVENLEKYIVKDIAIPTLLRRMRDHGKKTFLLTNSGYNYTNSVMKYLLDFPELGEIDWKSYFDLIVVDAKKPLFFSEGTILRQVDPETGSLRIGRYVGPVEKGQVYSGGSSDAIANIFQTSSGYDVLYFGDHIFGDVLKSKKLRGWRTFLIIPELAQEIDIWVNEKDLFDERDNLMAELTEYYLNLDSSTDIDQTADRAAIHNLKKQIKDVSHKIETLYGKFGSLFRSGSRQTFFATQTMRYADLYAASFINLINYPFSYNFRADYQFMPHEQTIEHGELEVDSARDKLNNGDQLGAMVHSLTSPLVARQQAIPENATDSIDGSNNGRTEASPVHIPKGKVLLRRATIQDSAYSGKSSGLDPDFHASTPPRNTMGSHDADESSSDTE